MDKTNLQQVFVFPLQDIVFYPHTVVPLNIFEPRYIKMVEDALETGTPIALVMSQKAQSGRKVTNKFSGLIAGMGEPQILHQNPDGSMIIILRGTGKVRLHEVIEDKPYFSCWASLIEENEEVKPENKFRVHRFRNILKSWVDENLEDPSERMQFLKAMRSPEQMVDSMAMFFIEDSDERQSILEKDDINQKIEFLSEHLKMGGQSSGEE